MKNRLVLFVLVNIICFSADAQKIEKYFDFLWKPCDSSIARFYSLIENTDSGWTRNDYYILENRLQMKGLYKDSSCTIKNGQFYYLHSNGVLKSVGKYHNNEKEGIWLGFHPNKMMSDSSVYENGKIKGTSLQWWPNGFISDSTIIKEDGSGVAVSWFDDGTVSSAGRLNPFQNQQGKWQYFHRNGKMSAEEIYDNGKLLDRKYFTETGTLMSDTTDHFRKAEFKGGIPAWLKYLSNEIYFPPNYKLINGDRASVILNFDINEQGDVVNLFVQTPFHPAFNDIAFRALKRSPKWNPAINHNRKVTSNFTQSITFQVPHD